MVDRVQFEETPLSSSPAQMLPTSKMTAFLMQKGIVKNETQAIVLLVSTIIVCTLGALYFFISATTETEVYQVEPPIEEQRSNS